MATPSTQDLRPYVSVKGFITPSPVTTPSRNVLLVGHILSTTTTFTKGKYTPISIGQITSKQSAVNVCASLGLTVKFKTTDTLDLTATDEIAAMLIMAAMEYQDYAPSLPRYTLAPCNFTIAVLDSTSTKTTNPYSNDTEDLLTNLTSSNTVVDAFVQPYEYVKGDYTTQDSYFQLLETFIDARWNNGKPNLGLNWALFADVTTVPTDIGNQYDITNFKYSTNFAYPTTTTSPTGYQPTAAILCAQMSVIMVGMQEPFYGYYGESLADIPPPESSKLYITDDQAASLLQYGWSPIRVNGATQVVYMSRMLSAGMEDPVTQIYRDYLLDFQDFRIFYLSMSLLYNSLVASGVINDRFVVAKDGTSPVLVDVINTAKAIDTGLYRKGMIAFDPKLYSNEYTAYLDPSNINKIIASKPLYPSSIIYQISETVLAQNFAPLLEKFSIVTTG